MSERLRDAEIGERPRVSVESGRDEEGGGGGMGSDVAECGAAAVDGDWRRRCGLEDVRCRRVAVNEARTVLNNDARGGRRRIVGRKS